MSQKAKVVIIGGGVAGCSLLYHLTKLGWSDVLLVEKDELTSGSTWHAAGLCTHFNSSYNMMKLLKESIDLYESLEAETGQAVDLHRCGSVRLADSQDRLDEFEHRKGIAQGQGFGRRRIAQIVRFDDHAPAITVLERALLDTRLQGDRRADLLDLGAGVLDRGGGGLGSVPDDDGSINHLEYL